MSHSDLEQQQREQAAKIILPAAPDPAFPPKGTFIFTTDVKYAHGYAFVACDIQAWPDTRLGTFLTREKVSGSYEPEFFAFYEGPVLASAIRRISEEEGLWPGLVITDGHGRAHPRRFGLACWLGLELGVPALGCAKNALLKYEGEPAPEKGGELPVILEGEVVGVALRTRAGVKPVYVSAGHLVHLQDGVRIVLALSGEFRIPEPQRRADQACNAFADGQILPGVTVLN